MVVGCWLKAPRPAAYLTKRFDFNCFRYNFWNATADSCLRQAISYQPSANQLIQPHQVHRSCGCFGFTDQVFGALTVVVQDADSYPPVAHWASELGHFCTVVTAAEMVDHLAGFFLVLKRANLHCPAAYGSGRRRGLHDFYF